MQTPKIIRIKNTDPTPLWQTSVINASYPYTFEDDNNYQSSIQLQSIQRKEGENESLLHE